MNKESQLQFLWNYFDRHSSQRLQMFNYYILVSIAVLTGIGVCLKESSSLLVLAAFLLIFLNYIFKNIDQRTVSMIKEVEKSIIDFEEKNIEAEYRIFTNEALNKSEEIKSYSKTFSYVFNILDFIGIAFIVVGLWNFFK